MENTTKSVFDQSTKATFAVAYPEKAIVLRQALAGHPLLTLDALAEMAAELRPDDIEYNRADLPVGVDPAEIPHNGLDIGKTIRTIDQNRSWMVLKRIEQLPRYRALLLELLGEIKPEVEAKTGAMLTPEGFIFISSPDAVTPFHFDPEHNILLQLKGTKTMYVWKAGDTDIAPDPAHEAYHEGGHRNLHWDDNFAERGEAYGLEPGSAIYVPVMSPHWVKVGPDPSISLSITWRSRWSYHEAEARRTNALLRKFGLNPAPPPRWPGDALGKSFAWRAMRRIGLVR